jgi:hypothetical protein
LLKYKYIKEKKERFFMAKVSFSKLGLTKNTQVGKFNWNE